MFAQRLGEALRGSNEKEQALAVMAANGFLLWRGLDIVESLRAAGQFAQVQIGAFLLGALAIAVGLAWGALSFADSQARGAAALFTTLMLVAGAIPMLLTIMYLIVLVEYPDLPVSLRER